MKKEGIYKNQSLTRLKDLESFLQLIADLGEKMDLYALGGTAMVIENIKESTKDIDFITTTSQKDIRRLLTLAGLKENDSSKTCNKWYLETTRIDMFYEGVILNISLLEDWKEKSKFINKIGPINLLRMGWRDIIFTKLDRNEPRDIKDCHDIIISQKIDLKQLKEEFYNFAETSIAHYKEKFTALEGAFQ